MYYGLTTMVRLQCMVFGDDESKRRIFKMEEQRSWNFCLKALSFITISSFAECSNVNAVKVLLFSNAPVSINFIFEPKVKFANAQPKKQLSGIIEIKGVRFIEFNAEQFSKQPLPN